MSTRTQNRGTIQGLPPRGQPQPPPPEPFQPAFGTFTELFLEARDVWTRAKENSITWGESLPRLNALILTMLFFGGVPTETIRAAGIRDVDDLIKHYETESALEMTAQLKLARNEEERTEILSAYGDKFMFLALTEVLRDIKEFMSENGLLHTDMITFKRRYGYTFYRKGGTGEE